MRISFTLTKFCLLLAIVFFSQAALAQFTAGNLALLRADGNAANNTTASIIQINTSTANQAAITTTSISGTGANAIRVSGSATSTGYMALSADKSLLCFTGHNNTTTATNANTLNPRAVVTLNAGATVNLATTYTGTSGNQTRCATTIDNTNFFIVDQGGINTNNSTTSSPTGNYRAVKTFGGIQYVGSAATTGAQVSTLSAITGGTVTGIPGLATNTAFTDFYLISSGSNGSSFDILYTTTPTSATAGVIAKYSLVTGSWVANGTYTTSFGGFGLAAQKAGAGANLFTTTGLGATAANQVIRMTDVAGYNATINITTANNVILHTAATGTTYKGIEFVPEVSALPTVALSASTTTASEAGQTVVTLTATTSTVVAASQTVNVAVSGTGITAADYTLSNTTITIPAGSSSGTVTFTIQDDNMVEGTETANVAINTPSAGINLGSPTSVNIAISDNDVATAQVNLSVSANAGTEEGMTSITVTATASAAVAGSQTVSLAVTGTGITATDFACPITITILNGNTTGSVTFKIRNDAELEGTETATLTISNPSMGILLGSTISQDVAITDFTCQPLIRKSTSTSANGAEISAFDAQSGRVYTIAGSAIEFYTINSAGIISTPSNVPFGFTAPVGATAIPNSVAAKNGIVAVGYAIVTTGSLAQQNGIVAFYTASTGAFLNSVTVGFLPDMILFNNNGTKLFTANEGEPNSYGQMNSFDPEGSVSIVDLSNGVALATVATAGFAGFNSQLASLKASGVRIYGPLATVAQDLEPEYISLSANENTAYITLQENNAVAVLDVATATITNILPLGLKDHNIPGNGLDASDQDPLINGGINIANWPVKGMYQPDAIASYTVGGVNYFITANEGDSRAYLGYSEELRVGVAGYVLDATVFPNAATLKNVTNLGRLQLTNATGDTDGDGDFDEIHALGARSFTIWNSAFTPIFDSGDQLEQITAAQNPTTFNSDGTSATFNSRSDNKGPEPEGVAIGTINGNSYAFIGSERTGDILVYNVTNPAAPTFIQYVDNPADLALEGILFVPANESPTGRPLLITSAEVSRTVTVYEFNLITNTLASNFTSVTTLQDSLTNYGNCTSLVATIKKVPNVANSIDGQVNTKVWIDATQNTNYVKRHYEINPTTNASTAEGIITLYFTQQNFDDFNAINTVLLPTNPADAAGIANLLVQKIEGTSSDNSGTPNSYAGIATNINPADNNIIWNALQSRWEVTFTTIGFSGFWIKTQAASLPVSWLNVQASLINPTKANIKWQVQEQDIQRYVVQKSADGISFKDIANTLSKGNGNNDYLLFDNAVNDGKNFYRIKQVSTNRGIGYSYIVQLNVDVKNTIAIYPTPAEQQVYVQVPLQLVGTTATLYNQIGVRLTTITFTSTINTLPLKAYAAGVYYLRFADKQIKQIIKK